MSDFLHVIAFDIPYPPTYGGAIDVYFRIKSLTEIGYKIILHCFEYNREKADVLTDLCFKVFYYKRNTSLLSHVHFLPYTVISRKNKQLKQNLLLDNYPIVFEGLMSCYYVSDPMFSTRKKIYREANIEHHYYSELFKVTKWSLSKLYYLAESIKFSFFERNLQKTDLILAISDVDRAYYESKFPSVPVAFIPCFHSNDTVTSTPGMGSYVMYHGNLSVPENEKAALYLCEHVFSKLPFRCVIAGMNPSSALIYYGSTLSNVEIIANPSDGAMKQLVRDAQVHLLVTFQSTGLKIKLLNTLFAGKHVLVNDTMLVGSGLQSLCVMANTPPEQLEACMELMRVPFSEAQLALRKEVLLARFSNQQLAQGIKSYLDKIQE